MLVGAASLPSAPLFVPGVARGVGSAIEQLQASVHRVARSLPSADVAVLVATGDSVLHDTVTADLAGIGYPQIKATMRSCPPAVAALSRLVQYPRVRRPRLPLDLACLALLVGHSGPVVALEVSATAECSVLVALGTSIVQALDETRLTGNIVVAGDLSAGLGERAPLSTRDGAVEWDARLVELFTNGDIDGLATLGPSKALAVGARGWAPLCVLRGAVASGGLTMSLRRYAAPRGVGYLITSSV
jgi:hypothetical protein